MNRRSPGIGDHKWLLRLLVIAAALLGGCKEFEVFEWTEEVRLSDGKVLTVERWDRCRNVVDAGAGFRRGCLHQDGGIRLSLSAPINREATWQGQLKPFALDIRPGPVVYLVGRAAANWQADVWKARLVAFQLRQSEWERIDIEALPPEMKPNLLQNVEDAYKTKPFLRRLQVSLDAKEQFDSTIEHNLRTLPRKKGQQ